MKAADLGLFKAKSHIQAKQTSSAHFKGRYNYSADIGSRYTRSHKKTFH